MRWPMRYFPPPNDSTCGINSHVRLQEASIIVGYTRYQFPTSAAVSRPYKALHGTFHTCMTPLPYRLCNVLSVDDTIHKDKP